MVAPVTATACPFSLDKMASLGVFLVGIHDPYDETLGIIKPVLTTTGGKFRSWKRRHCRGAGNSVWFSPFARSASRIFGAIWIPTTCCPTSNTKLRAAYALLEQNKDWV